jgi:hypothetical protein
LYTILYSYSSSFSLHLSSLEPGSFMFIIHVRGLWSLTILNFLSYK